MNELVNVKVYGYELLDMLMDRLDVWTQDREVKKLYESMYEHYIECGCFEGAELNVSLIVDNDYINYCSIIDDSDENYEAILEAYHNDDYDISCEDLGYSYIEAVSDDESLILVRC